jgi:glycosyltransferase involved in cell wall biosynthesis
MDRPFKTTLVIPTIDEIEGMRIIMPQINREWVDQIIILDGGSTDGTVEYAKANGYEVYVQKERGIRAGYLEVLPLVRGDVLIMFSPDGNSMVSAIPMLLDKMAEGYDMVVASRYLPPAKSDDDDLLTGFGNWFFTRLVNLLFRVHYTDVMGMYRAYRISLIKELELDQDRWYSTPEFLLHTRIGWEPMMSGRTAIRKLKVAEVPADEPPRLGGRRKLQIWRWGMTVLYQYLRDFLIWR